MKKKHWIILIALLFAMLSAALMLIKDGDGHPGRASASLETRVEETENVIRTDFVDADGSVTYATDRHYATQIKTRDEAERTLLEAYYDETGAPVTLPAGYSAILRTYDDRDRNTDILYLDADGQPVDITSGYARIARTYDDQDRLLTEFYFDADDAPTANTSGFHGQRWDYSDGGYSITYLDTDGRPTPSAAGYAMLTRTLNANGGVIEERYFDAAGAPCTGSLREYGYRRTFNADGTVDRLIYLDADGNPAATRDGYAIIGYVYDDTGARVAQMYYDANGNPTALARGEYGVRTADGRRVLLTIDGKAKFDLSLALRARPWTVCAFGLIVCLASALLSRRWNIALLAGYLFFIAYMTLMYRGEVSNRLNLDLFWSYRLFLSSAGMRQEILFNIWLFIPLGMILYRLVGRPWCFVLPVLLSVAVEMTQFLLAIGLGELDDVISNSLGGALGGLLGGAITNATQRKKEA